MGLRLSFIIVIEVISSQVVGSTWYQKLGVTEKVSFINLKLKKIEKNKKFENFSIKFEFYQIDLFQFKKEFYWK